MFIALVSWIVIGALVGFIASKNVNLRGDDPKLGLASGVIGAVTAGVIYRIVSGVDLGLSLRSVIFATVGRGRQCRSVAPHAAPSGRTPDSALK